MHVYPSFAEAARVLSLEGVALLLSGAPRPCLLCAHRCLVALLQFLTQAKTLGLSFV